MDVRGKKIYVGEVETVEALQNLLQNGSPTVSGYDISQPVKKLEEDHPDWKNADIIKFNGFCYSMFKKFKKNGK